MDRTRDMTVGSPARHILSFALPLIFANIGQQLYFLADAAIVGRGIGVKALAAVGTTDWCCWLIVWSMIGLTQGFSTYVSRHFGEKNYRDMNRAIAASLRLCLIVGLAVTVLGLAAAKPLLRLLGTPDELMPQAAVYLMIIAGGTPAVTAYNMAASILRAVGDGKTPLIAMAIAGLLNVGLDVLFVFGFHWGVAGAAVASVLSQLASFIYCLRQLKGMECVDIRGVRPGGRLSRDMLLFGLPIAAQYIIIGLSGIIVQSGVNAQGSIFIAGYTAPNKLYGLLESSSISLGLASSTFLAQNYGAGDHRRVKRGVMVSTVIAVVMALGVMGFVMLLRRPLILLFLDISEAGGPEALEVAVRYLSIMALSLVILYLIHVFRNALHAMEISLWSLISGFFECVIRVLMAKVAIDYIGTDALFLAEPVSWFASMLGVMLPYFYYRKKLLEKG